MELDVNTHTVRMVKDLRLVTEKTVRMVGVVSHLLGPGRLAIVRSILVGTLLRLVLVNMVIMASFHMIRMRLLRQRLLRSHIGLLTAPLLGVTDSIRQPSRFHPAALVNRMGMPCRYFLVLLHPLLGKRDELLSVSVLCMKLSIVMKVGNLILLMI